MKAGDGLSSERFRRLDLQQFPPLFVASARLSRQTTHKRRAHGTRMADVAASAAVRDRLPDEHGRSYRGIGFDVIGPWL